MQKKFQNIALLHFPTAKVSFLQIFHRVYKEPFSVFFVLVPADSCHIQHFLLVSGLQNAHMDKGFVGKDHIRGDFFLSGNLQAKSTELLKKGLILFSQLPDCRFRKCAPVSLFSFVSSSFDIFIVRDMRLLQK